MSTPAVYSPNVVEPSHVSQPHSYAARDYFNTIRDVLHRVTFHTEGDLQKALAAVDGYEKHVTGGDAAYVVSENDRAPVEDVSQRRPAASGFPALAPGQAIDYQKLAAAIVAASAQQQKAVPAAAMPAGSDTHAVPVPASGVPVITDAQVPGTLQVNQP